MRLRPLKTRWRDMADKKLRFDIGANSDEAQKALRLLQTAFDETVGTLKKKQGDIALFKAAQQDAAKLETEIKKLAKAGGDTTALNAALAAQRASLAKQAVALRQAGINTAALSTEQARLRFQVDQATRSFRSQSGAISSAQNITAMRNMGTAAAGTARQLALVAAGLLLPAGGLLAMVKTAVDAADSLNDLRQQTGLTVPTLNGLSFAAGQSGTDLGALAKGVGQFAKFVGAAEQPTSEQAKLLAALGVSAREPEAALMQIADLFAALPDGLEKTNLAMRLFGKSGADLIPLLNGGSAALREMMETGQALNPVTAEMAEKADELNDSLGRLKASGKGLGTRVAADIVPGLTQITQAMEGAAQEGGLLNALWVGLGGIGAALFTDDLLTSTQKLAKAQELLATARRKGFADDHKWVTELRAQIAAMEERTAAEEKSKQSAEESTKAAERRNEVQKQQSAQLIKIKEFEVDQVTAALDAQVKAYRAAQSAIEKTEKDRIALAEKNRQRLADLLAPDSQALDLKAQDDATRFGNQAQARSNLNNLLAQSQNALAAGDFEKAIELGEKAAALISELKEAGAQATSVLAAQLRDIASIQDQALAGRGEGEKAKADEAKAVLDKIKAELETLKSIPIGVDLPMAEAALLEANKRMQALLDANPLTQAVLVGGASGQDRLPAKADGGLLRGPGTGTSDSILMYGSNGEFMMRAAAVRKLGLARLNYMNRTGSIPGFANGGLIEAARRLADGRRMAIAAAAARNSLPRFAAGGLIADSVGSLPRPASSGSGATSILNLTLPGVGTFETRADAAVADSLERALRTAALKHGRRA